MKKIHVPLTHKSKEDLVQSTIGCYKRYAYLDFAYYHKLAEENYTAGNYEEARKNIDEAIRLANIDTESLSEDERQFKNHIEGPLTHPKLAALYSSAGKIYAYLGDEKKSLRYYQIYQYFNSFLKLQFKSDGVSAFTFRKVSAYALYDLISNAITVSPSWQMNDPFDSVVNFWNEPSNLKAISIPDKNKHIAEFSKSFNYYRIRSFCYEDKILPVENILMWSHYADEHKGFCVKYKLSKHFICQEENSDYEHMYLKKIIYRGDGVDIRQKPIGSNLAFATKKDDWSYENEMRLIVYNPNKDEPYYQIKLDDASSIEAIFFGFRCSKSDKDGIKAIFANRGGEMPKFYEMYHDPDDIYKLKYRPV